VKQSAPFVDTADTASPENPAKIEQHRAKALNMPAQFCSGLVLIQFGADQVLCDQGERIAKRAEGVVREFYFVISNFNLVK
jgi:hypothetical protein